MIIMIVACLRQQTCELHGKIRARLFFPQIILVLGILQVEMFTTELHSIAEH